MRGTVTDVALFDMTVALGIPNSLLMLRVDSWTNRPRWKQGVKSGLWQLWVIRSDRELVDAVDEIDHGSVGITLDVGHA